MHDQEIVAKSKGKEVGKKTIQLADNLKEATQIAGSEERVVELFNRQIVTDTRNSMARPSTGGVELRTKVALYHNMVKAGVPADKALGIAQITKDDIAKVAAAAA